MTNDYFFAVFFVGARFAAAGFFATGVRLARLGAASPFAALSAAIATTFSGRSETRTVRCAVRFSTRNARPMGAGRTRFCAGPWLA
jgi:hypothetical protein